jgi:signal peptidase I
MEPNYQDGELVLVWKYAFKSNLPLRGEVVVAQRRGEFILKRVLGLPGETVEISRGKLLVNHQAIQENYHLAFGFVDVRQGELKEDRYALFGDNRDVTAATAIAAVVSREQMLGRVIARLTWLSAISGFRF